MNVSKGIEAVANLSIVLAVLIGSVVLLRNHGLDVRTQARVESNLPATLVGTKISVPDVDWAQNKETLLFALSKGCHFCSESASFYKTIARQVASRPDIKLVAAFPSESTQEGEYLGS